MSLTRALLSGVSESSLDLSEYDYEKTASMESYYLDAACESLLRDIYDIDKAFMVADVVGEVQVIREGADPAVLLEGIVKDTFAKLKEGFKKFLAKIKAWFAKVKKFFQVLFMNGKELAKKYGDEIKKKSTKGFKYKGFKYTIKAGDALVDQISERVAQEINFLIEYEDDNGVKRGLRDFVDSGSNRDNHLDTISYRENDRNGNMVDEQEIDSLVDGVTPKTTNTDYQDKLVKAICGSSDLSDMGDKIYETYRDKDTEKSEIENFEANSPSDMVEFLRTFDKAIKDAEKEEKAFEKDVNIVIKALDKQSSKVDKIESTGGTYTYKLASKISSFISSALAVRKAAVDKKVSTYKEINSSWTSVLKSFVLKKEVKESAFFEDFDNMITLTEAADVEPETPDQDETGEGDDATKEGCRKSSCESSSLLESAYNYL